MEVHTWKETRSILERKHVRQIERLLKEPHIQQLVPEQSDSGFVFHTCGKTRVDNVIRCWFKPLHESIHKITDDSLTTQSVSYHTGSASAKYSWEHTRMSTYNYKDWHGHVRVCDLTHLSCRHVSWFKPQSFVCKTQLGGGGSFISRGRGRGQLLLPACVE